MIPKEGDDFWNLELPWFESCSIIINWLICYAKYVHIWEHFSKYCSSCKNNPLLTQQQGF